MYSAPGVLLLQIAPFLWAIALESHNLLFETIARKLIHNGFIQWKLTHSTDLETYKFISCEELLPNMNGAH